MVGSSTFLNLNLSFNEIGRLSANNLDTESEVPSLNIKVSGLILIIRLGKREEDAVCLKILFMTFVTFASKLLDHSLTATWQTLVQDLTLRSF